MKKVSASLEFFDVTIKVEAKDVLNEEQQNSFEKAIKAHRKFKSVSFTDEGVSVVFRGINDFNNVNLQNVKEFCKSTYRSALKNKSFLTVDMESGNDIIIDYLNSDGEKFVSAPLGGCIINEKAISRLLKTLKNIDTKPEKKV